MIPSSAVGLHADDTAAFWRLPTDIDAAVVARADALGLLPTLSTRESVQVSWHSGNELMG